MFLLVVDVCHDVRDCRSADGKRRIARLLAEVPMPGPRLVEPFRAVGLDQTHCVGHRQRRWDEVKDGIRSSDASGVGPARLRAWPRLQATGRPRVVATMRKLGCNA